MEQLVQRELEMKQRTIDQQMSNEHERYMKMMAIMSQMANNNNNAMSNYHVNSHNNGLMPPLMHNSHHLTTMNHHLTNNMVSQPMRPSSQYDHGPIGSGFSHHPNQNSSQYNVSDHAGNFVNEPIMSPNPLPLQMDIPTGCVQLGGDRSLNENVNNNVTSNEANLGNEPTMTQNPLSI